MGGSKPISRRTLPAVQRGVTLAAAALVVLAGCGGTPEAAAPVPAATPQPFSPVETAATPAATAAPAQPAGRFLVAAVRRPAQLRSRPGGAVLGRVTARTEFGSPTSLAVVGRRAGWLRVQTPVLPNHRAAWIPAGAAQLQATDYSIRIDRSARRATVRDGDRTLFAFTVAVGRAGNETPLGRFAVTDKLRPQDPSSPYGCCAVALTGHQTKLVAGWPGGDRLAIHNTPAVASVGQAASLGCLRAHRRPMQRLMRRLPLGTPVFIRA